MATFTYQARDEAGRLVKGILEADSPAAVADRLRKMGYLVTRMEKSAGGPVSWANLSWGRPVSDEQLLLTCIQLANLVDAGLPLVASLTTVASQTEGAALKTALEEVARDIEGGSHFSQALESHPRIFPKLMVSLVRVGEVSGELERVLNRFVQLLERDLTLKRSVQGALAYPVFLLAASFLLVMFLVTLVVPQFAALFEKAGLQLPAPTRLLAGFGLSIRQAGLLWAAGAAAVFMGGGLALKRSGVRRWADRWVWRIPLFGAIIQQSLTARFARSMATLVASGVPILTALEVVRGIAANAVVEEELDRVRQAVEHGERIAATLSVGKVFHPDVIQMIRVGEDSGRLDGMLDKVADYYDLRLNFTLKQIATLLEPILLVGMGGVVAFIMASLLLPMFDMVKVLHGGGMR